MVLRPQLGGRADGASVRHRPIVAAVDHCGERVRVHGVDARVLFLRAAQQGGPLVYGIHSEQPIDGRMRLALARIEMEITGGFVEELDAYHRVPVRLDHHIDLAEMERPALAGSQSGIGRELPPAFQALEKPALRDQLLERNLHVRYDHAGRLDSDRVVGRVLKHHRLRQIRIE